MHEQHARWPVAKLILCTGEDQDPLGWVRHARDLASEVAVAPLPPRTQLDSAPEVAAVPGDSPAATEASLSHADTDELDGSEQHKAEPAPPGEHRGTCHLRAVSFRQVSLRASKFRIRAW